MKISKLATADLISSFIREINNVDEKQNADIIKKHIGIFADYLGVDFIMLLQPIILVERHEFLYSPLPDNERIKIVKDLRNIDHRRRIEYLNKYEKLTHITNSKNNTTPLIDSNVYHHVYIYPIINAYKGDMGNGGIFYVNKNNEIELNDVTYESFKRISESIMLIYNKYRLNEMYRYANDVIKKTQTSLNSAFFTFDSKGIIREVNAAFIKLVEKSEDECIGKSVLKVLPLENHKSIKDYATVTKDISFLSKNLMEDNSNVMFVDYIKENGSRLVLKKYFTTVYEEPTIFRMVILENITEKFSNMEKIHFQTYHDALTGLHNINYYTEISEKLTASPNSPLAVIVGDINSLKLINDIFGHQCGDDVIIKVADLLKNNLDNGEVFRMGGDEFYIFLYDSDEKKAQYYIETVNRECKEKFIEYDFIGISMGYSISRGEHHDIDYYIKKAEAEMYYLKSINSEILKSKSINTIKTLHDKNCGLGAKRSKYLKSLAADFAKWLGLRKNEATDFCNAMELSELGRIDIEEKTLKSDHQLESMKTHCRIGYKIASLSYETSHLARIILSHHENWDGSGFPQGLKGSEIPFLSRAMSLIEYYADRLVNTPLNKTSIESVLSEIEERKGTVFDPKLADNFIDFIHSVKINNTAS